ncbi:hypothetical protein JYU20_04875, partial [Bacteroidales bacterium AH-315-I05]|nr:hypothetical protein [Bacteroidales bacterium AH-315-I05]
WSLMKNWNYLIPPSRPSGFQLNMIQEHCGGVDRNADIAVLGSTIEFRDLLHEMGFSNVFVFEKNLSFYEFTSSIRLYENDEQIVEGNWLDTLSEFQSNFSIILSDLTSGNISYSDRKLFYSNIENALSTDGFFCDKVLTHSNEFLSSNELIEKYKKLPINWLYANYFNCEMLFCSDLLLRNNRVDTNDFYDVIMTKTDHPRIARFVEMAQEITPLNFIWYYGKQWSELIKDYCPNLRVLEDIVERNNENPYKDRLHYIFLKK